MANQLAQQIEYFKRERQQVVQTLAQRSRDLRAPPPETGRNQEMYDRLDALLTWLGDVEMTRQLNEEAKVREALEVLCKKPHYFRFPPSIVQRSEDLYDRFEQIHWGEGVEVKPESHDDDVKMEDISSDDSASGTVKRKRSSPSRHDSAGPKKKSKTSSTMRLPPANHPIWGDDGIMHGAAISVSEGGRISQRLDPRYQQKEAKVYGHNDIEVGTWYPSQLLALVNGAHGMSQAGISGDAQHGAYSVVVSGGYETLDLDRGEFLFYSGSGSHDNTDPEAPAPSTAGTLTLKRSMENGRPVRVLRTSGGKSKWAPMEGLRYDGLYRVVSKKEPLNGNGGRYEQFKLVRLPDQGDIDKSRPSPKELADFDKIKAVWR